MKQQKNRKSAKDNNYLGAMIVPSIIGVALLITYISTKDVMVKILCAFITFTALIPFTLQLLNVLFNMMLKTGSNQNPRDVKDILTPDYGKINVSDLIHNNTQEHEKVPNKGKANPSNYYPNLRNAISSCSKNKLFTREDILKLKSEIDYCLGTRKYVYDKNFKFENDLHEIYIKIKSLTLKDKDYKHLLQVVNKIVQKNTKEVM